jgi:hypothetical protein
MNEEDELHGLWGVLLGKDVGLRRFMTDLLPAWLRDGKIIVTLPHPRRDRDRQEVSGIAYPLGEGVAAVMVVERGAADSQLATLFPRLAGGRSLRVEIETVDHDRGLLDPHVTAAVGPTTLTFLDTDWWRAGGFLADGERHLTYAFAGLAYWCEAWDPQPLVIDRGPFVEMTNRERNLPAGTPVTIEQKGMAVLLPDGDSVDYGFCGPVRAIRDIDILGQRCTVLTLTLMRDDDLPGGRFDLDVYVPAMNWRGLRRPLVGDDCRGGMALQGHHATSLPLNPRPGADL